MSKLVTAPAGCCRDAVLKLQMAVVFDLVVRLRIRFHQHHNDRNVLVTLGLINRKNNNNYATTHLYCDNGGAEDPNE